jgi:subtilisin family serine protease
VLLAGLLLAAAAEARAQEGCGPLAPSSVPGIGACREPGLSGSQGAEGFVRLAPPGPAAAGSALALPGEALLALPKGPGGGIPTDFALAPGARIVASFFSPVLCATVARVVGPPGAAPEALFTRLPDEALVVPHSLYRGAGAAVRTLGAQDGADPYRSLQHALDTLGTDAGRALGAGAGVRVAVLDSAPQADHPDLGGVRVRPLEDGPPTTAAAHGTLVTGVIRAVAGNGVGIAGVAPRSDTVAIPICSPGAPGAADTCRLYDALRGVDAAWEESADVANLSIVGPPNALLERAMNRLEVLGVLVVAAAGNEGTAEPRYPAAYPSVIGVGAVDRHGVRFVRGNRGPSSEIEAPGVEVLSTHSGGSYAFADGTSLAAAHVSGVLALLLGAQVDPLEARSALFAGPRRAAAPGVVGLSSLCELLARSGRSCPAP